MKKRLIGLILIMALLVSFVPVIAYAQTSGTCGDDLTWTLDDEGTLTISGSGDMYNWGLYGNPSPWRLNSSSIKSIVLDEGVTSIGDCAFLLTRITSITIPDSVKVIGYSAFEDCDNLTNLTIGNGVTDIGSCAFRSCINLNSMILPDSLTYIGDFAFESCSSLTSIKIPNGVIRIGKTAFESCYNLESITISDSVKSLEEYAFGNCSSLTSVIIGNSLTSIDKRTFCNCKRLTSLTIPDSVTSIGSGAFRDCNSLTDVYYTGSPEEWEAISVDWGNECLTDAAIHYNSFALPGLVGSCRYEFLGYNIENNELVVNALAENNSDTDLNTVSLVALYDDKGILKGVVPDFSAVPEYGNVSIGFKIDNYTYESGDYIKLFLMMPISEEKSKILITE